MTETVLMTLPRVSDANHTGFRAETNCRVAVRDRVCAPHTRSATGLLG